MGPGPGLGPTSAMALGNTLSFNSNHFALCQIHNNFKEVEPGLLGSKIAVLDFKSSLDIDAGWILRSLRLLSGFGNVYKSLCGG